MPEEVIGFLAKDGTFHTDLVLAQRHEAQVDIVEACRMFHPAPINPDRFLATIEAMADPIMRYLNAHREILGPNPQAAQEVGDYPQGTAEHGGDTSDDDRRKEELKALVE